MARGVNKVILIGNLGQDPEIKYTASGAAIANISIATTDSWNDKQTGEKQEKTEWHRIVAFGRLAEIIGEYVRKGSQVYIEGKLQTRKWEKDGHTNYTTEIVASDMQMLSGRSEGNSQPSGAGGFRNHQEPKQQPLTGSDFEDDDIPF